jgi:hypothetical protein
MNPKRVGGPFKVGPDTYHSYDQTATHFRLWQTKRAPVQLSGGPKTPARAGSSDAASGTSPESWEHGNPKGLYAGESEVTGTGAETWVGKRSNTTGYVIRTGDLARPGLVHGRGVAKQVAARVSTLEKINEANRKAWS